MWEGTPWDITKEQAHEDFSNESNSKKAHVRCKTDHLLQEINKRLVPPGFREGGLCFTAAFISGVEDYCCWFYLITLHIVAKLKKWPTE